MHIKVLIGYCFCLLWLCSCSQSGAVSEGSGQSDHREKSIEVDHDSWVCGNDAFRLTEPQIVEKQRLALRGNKEAAKALYCYYSLWENNEYLGGAWLYMGAALGDDVCIHNMNYSIEQKYFSRDRVFIIPHDQLSKIKKQALKNPVDCFLLYKHDMWNNDKSAAQKLLPTLKQFGVSEKLLNLKK